MNCNYSSAGELEQFLDSLDGGESLNADKRRSLLLGALSAAQQIDMPDHVRERIMYRLQSHLVRLEDSAMV